jgi:Tfp pilus assembly protein FimT
MAEENKPLPIAEIVTGVIICIILIVFALPRFMNSGQEDVIGDQASNLYYELVKAKNMSLKTRHQIWVQFNGTSGYTIFEDSNGNGTADAGEPLHTTQLPPGIQFGANLNPPLKNVWGTGNVQQGIELDGGKTELVFSPKGNANRGGAVYFINKADVGVTNANIWAVKIMGATGDISVMKPSPDSSPPWK